MPRRRTNQGRIETRLAAIMAERHMSVRQVAAACRLSRLTVYDWRDNRVTAYRKSTLAKYCGGLGVEVGALLRFVRTDRTKR